METKVITLTREQLFEKVWATPIQRLAKDFGLSDVGLAKLCRRNEIPVPGRGHWQRLEAGQNPERPGLPPLKRPEYGGPIEISHWERFNDSVDLELANAKAQEPKDKLVVSVPVDGPIRHPFAVKAENQRVGPTKDGRRVHYWERPNGICPIRRVTDELVPRALRIFDALLMALNEQGYSLDWPDKKWGECGVVLSGRTVPIKLTEIFKQVPHHPTREELKDQHLFSWVRPPKWDRQATGRLTLNVGTSSWENIRHTWTDGKHGRLEDYLGDVLRTVRLLGVVFKKKAEEEARQAQKEEERRRRKEELQRQQAEHSRKGKVLRELTRAYRQSMHIHEFLDSLDRVSTSSTLDDASRRELQVLTEWGRRYADAQDPRSRLCEVIAEFRGDPKEPEDEDEDPDEPYYGLTSFGS